MGADWKVFTGFGETYWLVLYFRCWW